MQTLPATVHATGDPFAATHWSIISAAGAEEQETAVSRAALAELCETYWAPLYSYVRGHGCSPHDAQDLTQGFFAYLIEHRIYRRTDRQKGKFRAFLLASLKHFLSDSRDRDEALKRGGGRELLSLNESRRDAAESLFQTHHAAEASGLPSDRLFETAWAEALIARVLERLAASYDEQQNRAVFNELRPFLAVGAAPLPSYLDVAARLGLAESSVRSQVTRLRGRYREILRAEVRRTVATEAEVDGELRELLRVLTGG